MALSESQLAGLQVAARRRNAEDLRNIDYATRTQGYRDPGSTTPSITPSQASASMGSIPTASTPRRASIAAPSRANLDAQLAAFRTAGQSLQSAYAPSTDLINTQKQLADLTASKEMGLAKASDTPIPMGVIVGQQAAIERRASTQALPLSARIAALQAEQTARQKQAELAASQAKDEYGMVADLYGNELATYNKRLEPINLSQGEARYQINPKTGEYERVAYGGDKPLSMSEQYGSGAIGEYNFYADQERKAGRKPMGFNEYQTLDANRKRAVNNTYISGQQYDQTLQKLQATAGTDGFINTDAYKRERNMARDKATFDKNYSYLLNPNDPSASQFTPKQSAPTAAEIDAGIWAWLASAEAQGMSDEDKKREIMQNGRNPESFGIY